MPRGARVRVRSVLLEQSFVTALLDEQSPTHTATKDLYSALVERYRAGADRLFALSTVLAKLPREFRRNALAPVLTLHVARQHHNAARRVPAASSPDVALALVMLRRNRISTVATASYDFDGFDLVVLRAQPDELDDGAAPQSDGHVSYEIGPLPAQRPTGR